CAALVDPEGETVDYGGVGDPYDIRILAAELRLLQQRLAEAPHLSQADQFMVRGQRKTFLLQALPEGYALAAQLPQGISEPSQRAVAVASERLSQEAGFRTGNTDVLRCRELAVEEACGGTHRPEAVSVDGEW